MKKGWEITNINDVCSLQNGFAFKSKDYSTSGARVIRITNVQNGYIADNNPRYMALESLSDYERFKINHDDILLSLTGDVGRVGRFPKDLLPALLNQRVSRLENINEKRILKDFLFFFLNSHIFEDNAVATAKGAAQKNISTKSIGAFQIPIPPLSEQEEIVEVLDTAFAAIDQAKANIEQNIANAKELFQSKFNNLFANRDDSWVKYTLQELLDMGWISSHLDGNHGGDYPRKAEFVESGISYLSAKCLKGGKVDFSKAKFLTPERAAKLRKGIAQDDDVLFAHNATVGPTALLKTDEPKVILGTSLTYYRCNSEHIEPSYLLLYMRSNEFCSQYREVMRQSTRNQVPITKQRTFFHIIPPLGIQNKLIPVLEELNATIEKLINVNQTKLASLNELKKSILQKAFAGELT